MENYGDIRELLDSISLESIEQQLKELSEYPIERILKELYESPIPFLDYEPDPKPRGTRKKRSKK